MSVNMEHYEKHPLKYTEQVNLLKSRGMIFADEQRAKKQLANISYYRLSAYMLPYKKKDENDIIIDEFKEGTTWENIYNLYVFDRKLRLLVFDAIERLEISIRTQIIYQLSHKYGSHWQDDSTIFKSPTTKTLSDGSSVIFDPYNDIQKHIKKQLNNNIAEVFIQHYRNKYDDPKNPPSWMSVEIMYFNHLSRICKGLKHRVDRVNIASYFALPERTFCSWLHTINYVRNICAHHARLWDRVLNIVPEKLSISNRLIWISNPDTVQRSKIYYFLCMLNYLLQTVNPTSQFKERLIKLLNEYKDVVNLNSMGFCDESMGDSYNWQQEKIWKM